MTEEFQPTPLKKAAMIWFKNTFRSKIEAAFAGTPFTLNIATAIATQESYWLWVKFYKDLPLNETLMLCVGDSIGEPNRKYFPKTVAALKAEPNGQAMFNIARQSFEKIAAYIPEYQAKLDDEPKVFCHGFGIFQYDIQFFKTNPDFFLQKKWGSFDECLKLLVKELKDQQAAMYLSGKPNLTDIEQTHVAIAYNCGASKFDLNKGLKQGHFSDGKFYGENIWDFLQFAKTIP